MHASYLLMYLTCLINEKERKHNFLSSDIYAKSPFQNLTDDKERCTGIIFIKPQDF